MWYCTALFRNLNVVMVDSVGQYYNCKSFKFWVVIRVVHSSRVIKCVKEYAQYKRSVFISPAWEFEFNFFIYYTNSRSHQWSFKCTNKNGTSLTYMTNSTNHGLLVFLPTHIQLYVFSTIFLQIMYNSLISFTFYLKWDTLSILVSESIMVF